MEILKYILVSLILVFACGGEEEPYCSTKTVSQDIISRVVHATCYDNNYILVCSQMYDCMLEGCDFDTKSRTWYCGDVCVEECRLVGSEGDTYMCNNNYKKYKKVNNRCAEANNDFSN